MKRYKKLWDQFISVENIELAAKKAVKSKKSKKSVQAFLKNRSKLLADLRASLINGTFRTSEYNIRRIFEPKERLIYILPLYPDHIVHHAIINILGPIWQSTFIPDSYACIPGKGLHKASHRVMEFMHRNEYVLQCDIRKFYPSINHQIMFDIVKKKVGDARLLDVIRDIIWSCDGEKNLPIGNLTSQWMGNVYLNELDHFVKEKIGCRDYIRYCDDFLLFGNDKAQLHKWEREIENFVQQKLKLTFSKSSVYPTARGVAFLGYRHFKDFIILRQYGARKMRKRVMSIIYHRDRSEHSRGQLAAYAGWARWCCSFNFRFSLYKRAEHASRKMSRFIKSKFLKLIDD